MSLQYLYRSRTRPPREPRPGHGKRPTVPGSDPRATRRRPAPPRLGRLARGARRGRPGGVPPRQLAFARLDETDLARDPFEDRADDLLAAHDPPGPAGSAELALDWRWSRGCVERVTVGGQRPARTRRRAVRRHADPQRPRPGRRGRPAAPGRLPLAGAGRTPGDQHRRSVGSAFTGALSAATGRCRAPARLAASCTRLDGPRPARPGRRGASGPDPDRHRPARPAAPARPVGQQVTWATAAMRTLAERAGPRLECARAGRHEHDRRRASRRSSPRARMPGPARRCTSTWACSSAAAASPRAGSTASCCSAPRGPARPRCPWAA